VNHADRYGLTPLITCLLGLVECNGARRGEDEEEEDNHPQSPREGGGAEGQSPQGAGDCIQLLLKAGANAADALVALPRVTSEVSMLVALLRHVHAHMHESSARVGEEGIRIRESCLTPGQAAFTNVYSLFEAQVWSSMLQEVVVVGWLGALEWLLQQLQQLLSPLPKEECWLYDLWHQTANAAIVCGCTERRQKATEEQQKCNPKSWSAGTSCWSVSGSMPRKTATKASRAGR
jgi:hypothetical protein